MRYRCGSHVPRAFAALPLMLILLLSACDSNDQGSGPPEEGHPSTQDVSRRPLHNLSRDQPEGPAHDDPIDPEPSAAELDSAAVGDPTRSDAEVFAILVNHAIKDQTAGSQGDAVVDAFARDLPPDSTSTIAENRTIPGNRVVPGSQSWIRSKVANVLSATTALVHLVEKIESPAFGGPRRPYVYWSEAVLTVERDGDRWWLVDYQTGIASERARFSAAAWHDVMDSGRGWRRFDVAGKA